MQYVTKIRVPVSTFAKFCAQDDQDKQRSLVLSTKNASGKGGGDYYQGFKAVLKTVCQMGQDIDAVEYALATLIEREEGPKKGRLSLLRDAFLSQWREHGYQFFKVQRTNVTVARLTLAVAPELGLLTRTSTPIAARLWLSKHDVLDGERDTFIFLLNEAKTVAQWPIGWHSGVWQLERGKINHEVSVTDELRHFTNERAMRFAELWDAPPQ